MEYVGMGAKHYRKEISDRLHLSRLSAPSQEKGFAFAPNSSSDFNLKSQYSLHVISIICIHFFSE